MDYQSLTFWAGGTWQDRITQTAEIQPKKESTEQARWKMISTRPNPSLVKPEGTGGNLAFDPCLDSASLEESAAKFGSTRSYR